MDQINKLFSELFESLRCQTETKSYIIGIFAKYKFSAEDLSKDSLSLIFLEANQKRDFAKFQSLGDWIFFCESFAPQHLKFASKDFYYNMGQISYWNCYKIINRQWKLFEELSDNFIFLTKETNKLSKSINITML